ncbi:MAG: hypothetical protein PVF09_09070 [Desulfobacterales bacterium]|jgi:hypothetical protein
MPQRCQQKSATGCPGHRIVLAVMLAINFEVIQGKIFEGGLELEKRHGYPPKPVLLFSA